MKKFFYFLIFVIFIISSISNINAVLVEEKHNISLSTTQTISGLDSQTPHFTMTDTKKLVYANVSISVNASHLHLTYINGTVISVVEIINHKATFPDNTILLNGTPYLLFPSRLDQGNWTATYTTNSICSGVAKVGTYLRWDECTRGMYVIATGDFTGIANDIGEIKNIEVIALEDINTQPTLTLKTNLVNNTLNYNSPTLNFIYNGSFINENTDLVNISFYINDIFNITFEENLSRNNLFNITLEDGYTNYLNISFNASNFEVNASSGIYYYYVNITTNSNISCNLTYTNEMLENIMEEIIMIAYILLFITLWIALIYNIHKLKDVKLFLILFFGFSAIRNLFNELGNYYLKELSFLGIILSLFYAFKPLTNRDKNKGD